MIKHKEPSTIKTAHRRQGWRSDLQRKLMLFWPEC